MDKYYDSNKMSFLLKKILIGYEECILLKRLILEEYLSHWIWTSILEQLIGLTKISNQFKQQNSTV